MDTIELDGQVVLKIVKHCQQALPSFVTGQLLGLDVGSQLEVTSSFPFPTPERGDGGDDDLTEYQMEMMRCLRDVNVDNNAVGWYQSTYFSSFIDESTVETQFNYQSNIKDAVLVIYDPSRARSSGLALRAFRLTDSFMQLYAAGKVTSDALSAMNASGASADVFKELTITVRTSHLSSALLLELQGDGFMNAHASDFARLELNTNPFLEKQLQLLIDCIEDLQQETNKLHTYERALQRHKVASGRARRSRGDDTMPDEDPSHSRPIAKPQRVEALLVINQMAAYLQQVYQFSGQSFVKLFLTQGLNATA